MSSREIYEKTKKVKRQKRTIWEDLWRVLELRDTRPPRQVTKLDLCIRWMLKRNILLMEWALGFMVFTSWLFYAAVGLHFREPQMYMLFPHSTSYHDTHSFMIVLPILSYWAVALLLYHVKKPIQLTAYQVYALLSILIIAAIMAVYNSCRVVNLHFRVYKQSKVERRLDSRNFRHICLNFAKDIRRAGAGVTTQNKLADALVDKTLCCGSIPKNGRINYTLFWREFTKYVYPPDDFTCCRTTNGNNCECINNTLTGPKFCFKPTWDMLRRACSLSYSAAMLFAMSYFLVMFAYILHHGKMVSMNPVTTVDQEELDHPFYLLRKTDSDLRRRMNMTKKLIPMLRRNHKGSDYVPITVGGKRVEPPPQRQAPFVEDQDHVFRVRFHVSIRGRPPRHKTRPNAIDTEPGTIERKTRAANHRPVDDLHAKSTVFLFRKDEERKKPATE